MSNARLDRKRSAVLLLAGDDALAGAADALAPSLLLRLLASAARVGGGVVAGDGASERTDCTCVRACGGGE